MPTHIALVLSLALLAVHARAFDEEGEPPWAEGLRAEADEAEDGGAPDAELTPELLLLDGGPERAPLEEADAGLE